MFGNRINTGGSPIFSFAHATDLHYETIAPAQVPEANKRISCLIEDINGLDLAHRPDFILLSGDLTNCGAADQNELLKARSVCESFDIPYYTVAGNHDLAPSRKFAAMYPGKEDYHEGLAHMSNYAKVFPLKFSFQANGYCFVGVSLRDEDPDGMLDWLEAAIDTIPGKGIVVAHYGLYPPRAAGPLHTWGFSRIAKSLPRLKSIIADAGSRIVAYLYGHNHINSFIFKNGTCHISGGGIQKGCTGYRLFKCYEDRMESSFHMLSDKTLLDFNYWGRDKPEECMDDNHGTVEEYHRGNNDEQSFVIRISENGNTAEPPGAGDASQRA